MKPFLAAIIGFGIVFLIYTLPSSLAFFFQGALYASCLYALFFISPQRPRLAFLVGVTIGTELLGTSHLGQATLLATVLLLSYHLFNERLRFTSPFGRYIVALLITLLAFTLFLFLPSTLLARLPTLIFLFLLTATISFLLSGRSQASAYELI